MKKVFGAIVTIVIVILVIFGGLKAYDYYQARYASTTAYAKVPAETPVKEQVYDDQNKKVDGEFEYKYKFKFVTENNDIRTIEYSISGTNPQPLIPNTYIQAKISKRLVIKGPFSISKAEIPSEIVKTIN